MESPAGTVVRLWEHVQAAEAKRDYYKAALEKIVAAPISIEGLPTSAAFNQGSRLIDSI